MSALLNSAIFEKQGELTESEFSHDAWDAKTYSPVIIDDVAANNVYRMYYTAYEADGLTYGPAYAESTDLVNWTKPILNQVTYAGNTNNNLLIAYDQIVLNDVRILDGEYVLLVRNSISTSNLIYTSPLNDGKTFTYRGNAFTNASHGEHVESKCVTYENGVWRIYYSEGHFVPDRRSIGYYSGPTLTGPYTDQGLLAEFTSSSITDQYYDLLPWNYAGALWACVPRYNATSDVLGPLSLWRSSDDGLTWEARGNLLVNGPTGAFDNGLMAAARPILVNGLWRLLYVGSDELHDTWPRAMTEAWAVTDILDVTRGVASLKFYAPFAETKNLTPLIGPTGVFRRSSTAGYYDAAGVYQYAPANTPAFDHATGDRRSLGVSLFGYRANLVPSPEDFSTAWGTDAGGAAIVSNVAEFIDGNTVMDRLDVGTTFNKNRAFDQITASAATYYEISCFYKDDGARYAGLSWLGATNDWCSLVADLELGSVTQISEGATSGDIDSYGIEPVGEGIYRLWMIAAAATANPFIVVQVHSSGTPTLNTAGSELYTPTAGSDLIVCGASVTLGNFLTPYHPAAHNTDDFEFTDLTWFDDDGGTFYVEVTPTDLSADATIFSIGVDGSGSDALTLWFDQPAGTVGAFRATTTGNDGYISMADVATAGVPLKIAVAYKNNDMAMYINGAAGTPDNLVTVPPTSAADSMKLGQNQPELDKLHGYIGELRYYDRRLADAVLQQMTLGMKAKRYRRPVGFYRG